MRLLIRILASSYTCPWTLTSAQRSIGLRTNLSSAGNRLSSLSLSTDASNFAPSPESLTSTTRFSSLMLPEYISKALSEMGLTEMTPIQSKAIPLMLDGKDCIGKSPTGSGKTVAFTVPILAQLDGIQAPTKKPRCLILSPTRELAKQTAGTLRKIGRLHPGGSGIQIGLFVGGGPMSAQVATLEHGLHVVIGTPGRIFDLLEHNYLDLSEVTLAVLDEADRLLDMGFQDQTEGILRRLTMEKRQTAFFSATMPPSVRSFSRKWQKKPIEVDVAEGRDDNPTLFSSGAQPSTSPSSSSSLQSEESIPSSIRQHVLFVENREKARSLLRLLDEDRPLEVRHPSDHSEEMGGKRYSSVIVFCNTKQHVDEVSKHLLELGMSVCLLHGDMDQKERDKVITLFRNGSRCILVATDIASRGLDIPDVDLVVQLEVPENPSVYLHRTGRTGRAGRVGRAVILVDGNEHEGFERVQESVGAGVIEVIGLKGGCEDDGALAASLKRKYQAPMETIRIDGGKKDKVRAGDVMGALTIGMGLEATDVGQIAVEDRICYVAVRRNLARRVLSWINDGTRDEIPSSNEKGPKRGKIKGKYFKASKT